METRTPVDALLEAERRLEHDRARVTQSVALRAAQIKHVLSMLKQGAEKNENTQLGTALERLTPPMNPEKLISYALDAHERFSKEIVPLVEQEQKSGRPFFVLGEKESWEELENVLLDVRRLVVQNLSKHPGMKPYRLLSEWETLREAFQQSEKEMHAWETKRSESETMVQSARAEQNELVHEPGFDTFSRLESSRETLLRRKKELIEEWLRVWKEVEPILHSFAGKMKTFQNMENAQSRVLQLYLANPPSARGKDTHGAGLLMLLRLAVESLEEKKAPLKKSERESARAVLLRALENPVFVRYFEYARELEVALEANQREYGSHPIFFRRMETQRRENEARHAGEEASRHHSKMVEQTAAFNQKLVRLQKEAEEACRLNLGFTIRWEEE